MEPLITQALRCELFRAGRPLLDYVLTNVDRSLIGERAILVVTSKIVSIAERRFVSRTSIDKSSLVRREADQWLCETPFGIALTIKEGLLIPSAGIDESNSENGDYLLYPERPFVSAAKLWAELRAAWGLRDFGVLLADSRVSPLRRGTTGVALSYWGFNGVKSLIGQADLFARELRVTQINVADGLAAAAVLAMGEGAERRPLAIIRGADATFVDRIDPAELRIPAAEDLFSDLLHVRAGLDLSASQNDPIKD